MNYDEIIAIHEFFIERYNLSANLTYIKQQAAAVNGYIASSADSFMETLVDSGRDIHLAYLRKTISVEEVEQELLNENIALVAFVDEDPLKCNPVLLTKKAGQIHATIIADNGNLYDENWSKSFVHNY